MVSTAQLRLICQPPDKLSRDRLIGRYVYRKISPYCTTVFIAAGLSANAVSALSCGLLITAILCYVSDGAAVSSLVIGASLLQVSILLDYSDGELARYWRHVSDIRTENLAGEYVDNLGHVILQPLAIAAYGVHTMSLGSFSAEVMILGLCLLTLAAANVPALLRDFVVGRTLCQGQPSPTMLLRGSSPSEVVGASRSRRRFLASRAVSYIERLFGAFGPLCLLSGVLLSEATLRQFGAITLAGCASKGAFSTLTLLYVARGLRGVHQALEFLRQASERTR